MESSNQIEKAQPDRGSFDNSFGVAGRVYLYDPVAGVRIQPRAMCVLDDGRMIIASCSNVTQFTYLTLLNDRGEVVSEFGDSGTVRFKLSNLLPERLLAQPCKVFFDEITEKFIMGFYTSERGYSQKVGLAQFNVSGELDDNYGLGGVMIWRSQAEDDDPEVLVSSELVEEEPAPPHYGAMVRSKDGGVMILATLHHQNKSLTHLVKVGTDGLLDNMLEGKGYKLIDRNNSLIRGEDLIVHEMGYLVVATTELTGEGGWFAVKYDEDGRVNTKFAEAGYYDGQPKVKKSVLYRADRSQLFFAGTSANAISQHLYLALQRRKIDGAEDAHYGPQGWGGALSNGWTDDTVVRKAALYSPESTVVMAGVEYRATVEESRIFIAKVEQDMGFFAQFGGGKVFLLGETVFLDLAIQRDGKIIFISGYNGEPNSNSIGRLIG